MYCLEPFQRSNAHDLLPVVFNVPTDNQLKIVHLKGGQISTKYSERPQSRECTLCKAFNLNVFKTGASSFIFSYQSMEYKIAGSLPQMRLHYVLEVSTMLC